MEPYKIYIQFLGAAKTVTGSKFLVRTPSTTILIDCGLFQGLKEVREKNWQDLPISAATINTVLLTHGHLDHTGYLPKLVDQQFDGGVLGTEPTLAIARIILEDSAHIQEEDAKRANKEGFSKHDPAIPLYTHKKVARILNHFKTVAVREWIPLGRDIQCRFMPVGHIIGATFIELDIRGKIFVFSGDVGRPHDYLLAPPLKPRWADFLFLESTYGDRWHGDTPPETLITKLVTDSIHDGGTLIIPSFAVERLQTLMLILWTLYKKGKIPKIPIFVDSPMGNKVLSVFEQFPSWHSLSLKEYKEMCQHFTIVTSYRETWEVIDTKRPKIVIAGSGMVTGGRVLTYLKMLMGQESTRILLVGYQAEGTRGRQLQEGTRELKLFGKFYLVNAQVYQLHSLSAHADQRELIDWLSDLKNVPERVFLIHGELNAASALRVKLETDKQWQVYIPSLLEEIEFLI